MEEKKPLREMSDGELVALARDNNAAEEELLNRYFGMVRRYARRFILPSPETEELIQEGMLGLSSAVKTFNASNEKGASFKTYASVCIRRKIGDAMKKKRSEKFFVQVPLLDADEISKELTPEQVFIEHESWEEFMQKISVVLSDYEFRVFYYYADGMNYSEIATLTKKTEKSVDNAVQRARKKLQKLLKKQRAAQ